MSDLDRTTHRALVEAGYATLDEYVARWRDASPPSELTPALSLSAHVGGSPRVGEEGAAVRKYAAPVASPVQSQLVHPAEVSFGE